MLSVVRVAVGVLASALLGVGVAVLGVFQHATTWTIGGVDLPVGVVAGVAALVLAQLVARDAVPLGVGPAVVLVAWTVTAAVLGTSRPEGDLALPATTAGTAFLYGGFLIGLAFAATLALRTASGLRSERR